MLDHLEKTCLRPVLTARTRVSRRGVILAAAGLLAAGTRIVHAQMANGRTDDGDQSADQNDDGGDNDDGQTAPPGPGAWRRVASTCRADTKQFCPTLTPASSGMDAGAHEEATCLKFYRTDLSPGCRGAIDAVTR